jgi:hypothetical protein
MSQTIVVSPAPTGTDLDSGTLRARLASAWTGLGHALSGTPGRLRIVSGIAVLASVLVAFGGGAALRERSAALDAASQASAHLLLVQGVQTKLVQADADATNSFLGFGLEPVNQRLEYIAAIESASHDLAVAAAGSPEDAAALGNANADLTRFTGYISSARANNRLGEQVGANYLSTANALLLDPQTGIVSQLEARSLADQAKIDSAYSRATHAAWWLALVALVGLGLLVGAQLYLTRRSRRILNLPLAGATAALLVALIVAAAAMAVAQSRAGDVRTGSLDRAIHLSQSRVEAFSAKSTESLTLIQRGSSTAADPDWTKAITAAKSSLPSGNGTAASALNDYATKHAAINKTDVNGGWPVAVKDAISFSKGSANASFQIYADQTQSALATQASETKSGLSKAGNALLPAGVLIVLFGLLAALAAWWGVTLRLDEYR